MAHSNSIRIAGTSTGPSRNKLVRFASYLGLWRERRALARLDDDALRDIGLTQAEAGREAERPLWDVP